MLKSQELLNDYDIRIQNDNHTSADENNELNTFNETAFDGNNDDNEMGSVDGAVDAFFSSTNINDYSSASGENEIDSDASYDESSSDDDSDGSNSASCVSGTDGELSLLLFEQRYSNAYNPSTASKKNRTRQLQNKILRQQQRRKRNTRLNSDKELLTISSMETIRLRQWRVIVFVTIILLGAIGTTWIHLLTSGNKKIIAAKELFLHDAIAIKELCLYRWLVLQQSIESFATSVPRLAIHPKSSSLVSVQQNESNISPGSFLESLLPFYHTSHSKNHTTSVNATTTFPNVIIPNFEFYANQARSLSGNIIDSISFVPLIYNSADINDSIEEVSNWNKFSQEHYQQTIQDTVQDFENDLTLMDELILRNGVLVHPTIWSYHEHDTNITIDPEQLRHASDVSYTSKKYYGPIWQISPLIETTSSDVINFDLLSLHHISMLLDTLLSQNQYVLPSGTTKQENSGLVSAVTTNLGPLYCMSTSIQCAQHIQEQKQQIQGVTTNISDSHSTAPLLDNEGILSTFGQFENVFGASERHLPRSLYLQPIYDNNKHDISDNTMMDNSSITDDLSVSSNTQNLTSVRNEQSLSLSSLSSNEEYGATKNSKVSNDLEKEVTSKSSSTPVRQLQLGMNGTKQNHLPVGVIASVIVWDTYLDSIAASVLLSPIFAVLKNTCGQSFTYHISGGHVEFVGPQDLHVDVSYEDTEYIIPLGMQSKVDGQCSYSLHLYAAQTQLDPVSGQSLDVQNAGIVVGVAILFLTILFTFTMFDKYERMRIAKVLNVATRGERILATLFPKQVRDRMFEEDDKAAANGTAMKNDLQLPEQLYNAPTICVTSILNSCTLMDRSGGNASVDREEMSGNELQEILYKSKPIADLFPETTILFADIAGFTAWSSVREPSQVFVLLETLYGAFDMIAKRRHVFKVETVGDCYVAACGLPEPCEDHAVVMARFARLCMEQMRRIVRALERSLGPDTAELAMRAGMHSGPVTAGVLRGERSRFQLFGDTMNTAARMEQSGVKNRIQVTEDTYRQLCDHGKQRWLILREDKVSPKGKGEMVTYWLKPSRQFGDSLQVPSSQHSCSGSVGTSSQAATSVSAYEMSNAKITRLIDWNVQVLEELLKRIVARREVCQERDKTPPNEELFKHSMTSAIDEVREIINLPRFDDRTLQSQRDPESIQMPKVAIQQLHQFVQNIAAMYRDNPFHNFEHASHVLMSVYKLLNRIIAPDITCGRIRTEMDGIENMGSDNKNSSRAFRRSFADDVSAAVLHDHTYGITSDPLTQFACVLSALIHDCDHPGVPNTQLVKENAVVAIHYKQQSIAEQNSIDLAWALLMSDDYVDLRSVIYQTDAELKRFRELVVNSVMATDIADKNLKALRNRRWDVAFNMMGHRASSKLDAVNRKATIVIEHLIQASDVSHTMQHWHVYRKWNERFYMECYEAYVNDRAEKDPSEYWYQGEIGFFDFYIIPLAKKLKDCGVFGVSSDECLNYAVKNRQEWEARGVEIVNELAETARSKHAEFCAFDSFDM